MPTLEFKKFTDFPRGEEQCTTSQEKLNYEK